MRFFWAQVCCTVPHGVVSGALDPRVFHDEAAGSYVSGSQQDEHARERPAGA